MNEHPGTGIEKKNHPAFWQLPGGGVGRWKRATDHRAQLVGAFQADQLFLKNEKIELVLGVLVGAWVG